MSGLKITVDATFKYGISIKDDERVNAGSILLIEPGRDNIAGIPATFKNYAVAEFLANSGKNVATVATLNTLTSNASALVERTAKGGLHAVVPQSGLAANSRFALLLPKDVLDYCVDHADHKFYMSMIAGITRHPTAAAGSGGFTLAGIAAYPDGAAVSQVPQSINFYQTIASGSVLGGTPNDKLINRTNVSTPSTAQSWLVDVAKDGLVFTPPVSTSNARGDLITMGARGSTSFINGVASWRFYSIYLEDMTVSGNTYEQCHANSLAMYNKKFGADGKYANDTWTIPA